MVSISATDAQAIEGETTPSYFTVSQSNLSTLDTVVDVTLGASSNISAADLAGISYTNAAGNVVTLTTSAQIQAFLDNGASVKIAAGSTVAPVITVTVADDAIYEQSEELVLNISNPSNATIGNNSATGVILTNQMTLPTQAATPKATNLWSASAPPTPKPSKA